MDRRIHARVPTEQCYTTYMFYVRFVGQEQFGYIAEIARGAFIIYL
jgi:hypothetical protein